MAKSELNSASFLNKELSKIEAYILQRDSFNPKVSKVDVAWHLDHMLKTVIVICKALEASNPAAFKPNFNLTRSLIYIWGDFPRGVAKSPRVVLPPDNILTEDLHLQIETVKENLKKIQGLDSKAHFEHPYFSVINKRQSIKFLKIHTRHHLKIVADILKGR
ncbi:DUF1569 domain-containing protein [Flagellimonas pacifica]|uniref:DUF1569 domain-containing protein n=1 Tax=Flagellimonas pacifica TaxID=1247520 RepID=A0A285MBX2_9FLAO|nr:DUF1569 domain-containing protein [Allomuricauda parva]SNY94665.1 hypothetical protein SAMN06265377_0325 [Allomuricauda parva]